MKITELIAMLQAILAQHGDKDVCYNNHEEGGFMYVNEVIFAGTIVELSC